MKKRISLLLVGSLCLWNFSCYYDQELVLPEVPDIPDDVEISFQTDIEPLFSATGRNCVLCHNGSQSPDLRTGNSYAALVPGYVIPFDAEGSLFYQKLPGIGHGPAVPQNLSSQEIALITGWIDRGAEDN